jgi:hypothetical protein
MSATSFDGPQNQRSQKAVSGAYAAITFELGSQALGTCHSAAIKAFAFVPSHEPTSFAVQEPADVLLELFEVPSGEPAGIFPRIFARMRPLGNRDFDVSAIAVVGVPGAFDADLDCHQIFT